MKRLFTSFLLVGFLAVSGCAALQKGSDPLVVRAEQTQSIAYSAFETAMLVDNANRTFWKTNTPAFHLWCENMREPIVFNGTNIFPRGIAILKTLDDVKLSYKAGYSGTNALMTALAVVETAMRDAEQFISSGASVTNIPSTTK